MKRGKFESPSRRKYTSKVLVLVLAVLLIVGVSVGGTLAWLQAKTENVTNTFTSAELFADPGSQFTIWEHKAADTDKDGIYTIEANAQEVPGNTYDVLPGVNIPKDPTVDIVNLLENAYLYIKVTGLPMAGGLSATIDSTCWEALGDNYPGIYVYKDANGSNVITPTNALQVNILTQNQDGTAISVPVNYDGTAIGDLTFYAYMVQAAGNGDDAVDAWDNADFTASNP